MSLNNIIKRLQDIMRNDQGVTGNAQRVEQIVWLLFLKIYDAKEQHWEIYETDYDSIIPDKCRWREWAVDNKDGEALTGDSLLDFVNNTLFKHLKSIEITEGMPTRKIIVKEAFEDAYNYMKDGVLLRQVINVIDEIDFTDYNESHAFNDIYEQLLKDLQAQRDSGEFYTPRAVTDFMVKMIDPKLGQSIADFACGTGGFLVSALKHLEKQAKSTEEREQFKMATFGVEKKALPHLLSVTNLMLHDVDDPRIVHGNSLEKNVRDYKEADRFDIILMNPPYGGSEKDSVKINFPKALQSSETADLFMSVIMYRLKNNGKAAIILPDGFLFGVDNAKTAIKEKLMNEFNLHTIIRMPHSVFAPYTSITTNILFFDKTGETKETWFYRMDMPDGYKNFSKTKPIKLEHFKPVMDWWENKVAIEIDRFDKARKYTKAEIIENHYNLDLCGIPHEEEIILEPKELIANYYEEKREINQKIDAVLAKIQELLDGEGI
ncbi:MAG TPA: class I SAM-dependent DNA methyltransferase [Thermotogota bacterium]|nr:class I SAM-dependent DNA methyltransferase [Thermotogota bacterium]